MKNALNNQVGMLGDMLLWLVANLKQGVIYFIKQALPSNISAGIVRKLHNSEESSLSNRFVCTNIQANLDLKDRKKEYSMTCLTF